MNSSISSIIITDYNDKYINKYYHSHYDNNNNIDLDDNSHPITLCKLANSLTKSIIIDNIIDYSQLNNIINEVKVDCNYINILYKCLTQTNNPKSNLDCDYANSLLVISNSASSSGSSSSNLNINGDDLQPTHYSSIFLLETNDYIASTTKFYSAALLDSLNNSTGLVHYHDAVDPALTFNYDGDGEWIINPLYNDTYIWTESNWDNSIGTIIYRVENPKIEQIIFAVGFVWLILSLILVYIGLKYFHTQYKRI